MDTKPEAPELARRGWRVYLAAIALVASLPCAAYLFFVGLLLSPLPPALNGPLCAFLVAALAILLVALAAPPSHRMKLAVCTAVAMLVLSIAVFLLIRESLLSALIAAVGIAAFTLWLMPK